MHPFVYFAIAIFVHMLTFSGAEASNQYFDIPVWPGDEESCPAPRNIRNNGRVFSAPAKSESVGWIGILPGDRIENIVSFEKAVFVLTQENSDTRGFLSACIYTMSKGGVSEDEAGIWN